MPLPKKSSGGGISNCEKLHFVINASASPEGGERPNEALALLRAESLADWLMSEFGVGRESVEIGFAGVGWDELRDLVLKSGMEYSSEVADIIENVPVFIFKGKEIVDSRRKRLMDLGMGNPYRYMLEHIFPLVRNSKASVRCISVADTTATVDTTATSDTTVADSESENHDEAPVEAPTETPVENPAQTPADTQIETHATTPADTLSYHPQLKVKTNAVGLSMMMANAGIEVDVHPKLSVNIPVYYSGINYFTSTVKFRFLGFQPELRYWPGPKRRLYAGLHLGVAYYNFAWGKDWRYQDKGGKTPTWGGGLGVGYRLPMDKEERWNVEFTIGAGLYDLNYDRFYNVPNGALESSNRKLFIGLDNVAISFSYSFDMRKKGGEK